MTDIIAGLAKIEAALENYAFFVKDEEAREALAICRAIREAVPGLPDGRMGIITLAEKSYDRLATCADLLAKITEEVKE